MPELPRAPKPDSTVALLRDPYRFISKRCADLGTDLFETRLLLQKAICLTGPEAAELFYDPDRFQREGAMPGVIQKTLLGQGGVQGLDGAAHRHRKGMFMALMTPDRIEALVEAADAAWQQAVARWDGEQVVLFDEACEILTRAVCAWASVPLPEDEVEKRTRQLTLLFDGAGAKGPRHLASRLARKRANAWVAEVVESVRAGRHEPAEDTAAYVIAHHEGPKGEPLSPHVAAVALLNVVRPVVAVAVYVAFVAHALHEHPASREALRVQEEGYARLFVQEVRRFYPFFPAVAAQTRCAFSWSGYAFPEGVRVLLDLYGTNRDARTWSEPDTFRPERFRDWDGDPFTFIPQGGSSHYTDHRCAGEWITIALMQHAADLLARRLHYDVPEQDFQIDYARLPALPKSKFIVRDARLAA